MSTNRPIATLKSEEKKSLRIAIWEGTYGKTASLSCSYFDKKTDKWVPKTSFWANEIPLLIEVFQQAYQFMTDESAQRPHMEMLDKKPEQKKFEDHDLPSGVGEVTFADKDIPF